MRGRAEEGAVAAARGRRREGGGWLPGRGTVRWWGLWAARCGRAKRGGRRPAAAPSGGGQQVGSGGPLCGSASARGGGFPVSQYGRAVEEND